MRLSIAFLFCLFLVTDLSAQSKQTITKSSVTYQIKNMGFATDGNFSGLQANINFDPAHLETSSIEATIDANTVNSDNNLRDDHLKGEEYFDAARYPKITMKSVSFKRKSGNNYLGVFNVTIKGKTKQTEVPFIYTESGGTARFKGSFKINRLDFGVGSKSMVLADEATVSIDAETAR